MNREEKAAVIDEIAGEIEGAQAVFAVDYRGISVPQAAELRTKLRDADATFRIVKNSLTELAADKAGAESLRELLEGPTALTFVRGDAAMAAKAIADFTRATELLQFKGGTLDGAPVSTDEIKAISRLPARDVLNGQLVGIIATPLTGLVRGLNQLIAGFASQLQQIADQGLVTGEAPAPEPAAEEAPAEDPAAKAEEAPAEEAEAAAEEEAPAEDTPAEESPEAEEAPAEEAEAPAEEAPAEEPAADEAPVEEAPAEEAPAEEAAAEEEAPAEAADAPAEAEETTDDNEADASADADDTDGEDAADAKEE
jgi:large subunit ribosomal protein L10